MKLIILALALLISSSSSLFSLEWTPLYRGVSYGIDERQSEEGALRLHVIRADLTDPDVRLFVTPPSEEDPTHVDAMRPSTFVSKYKTQVAVNANAYFPAVLCEEGTKKLLEGMAISSGVKYSTPQQEDTFLVALKDGEVRIVDKEGIKAYDDEEIDMAIGSWPVRGFTGMLIDKGEVRSNLKEDELAARTAIGISEDNETLYLVVAEGGPRTGGFWFRDVVSAGTYLKDLAAYMKDELDCYYAMNLDGGGASTMVLNGPENNPLVVNLPSDYREEAEGQRAVGNHLGLYASPLEDSDEFENNFNGIAQLAFDVRRYRDTLIKEGLADPRLYIDTTPNHVYLQHEIVGLNDGLFSLNAPGGDVDSFALLSDLRLVNGKPSGKSEGGVYRDTDNLVWFVKKGQSSENEYIASKLMNLLIGDRSSYVKLVVSDNGELMTASRQILGFTSLADGLKRPKPKGGARADEASVEPDVNIIEEGELAIMMDYLGIGDRHAGNLGYIPTNAGGDEDVISARIDYDHSFIFEGAGLPSDPEELFLNNPEAKKYFIKTINKYGFSECKKAISDITKIPDVLIELIVNRCLDTLSATATGFDPGKYEALASALIARKEMLKEFLESIVYLETFVEDYRNGTFDKSTVMSNITNVYGNANGLLAYAGNFGLTDLAQFLTDEYGANLNAKDEFGRPVLMQAIIGEQDESVEYLLDNGANPNNRDFNDRTPLHTASRLGKVDIARLLLSRGADVKNVDVRGITPLHAAIANGHFDVFELLLDSGADIEAADENQKTVIFYGMKRDREEFLRKLLERGCKLDARDKYGRTPLHLAARSGYKEVVELLISYGTEVNAEDIKGRTPLYHASGRGRLEVAEFLIEKGALVEGQLARDDLGRTPLHAAVGAYGKNYKVAERLIEIVGQHIVEEEDINGRTPIFYAAGSGHLNSLMLLVDSGADVTKRDHNGKTALHFAAGRGHKDVAIYLIGLGLDVNLKDKNGKTALFSTAYRGHLEMLEFLVESGAKTDIVDVNGRSPLHSAASAGHKDVVDALIKSRLDIDITDNYGRTALFNAAHRGQLEVVQSLISAGADLGIVDNNGRSPLHYAIGGGHKDVENFLIKSGLDIDTSDNYGRAARN